ncbi:bile acid:sodium symporter family protein [Terasakiispira papahanaumokuakeensis]|nr:bile acid:sodium symporter family protein [Terasakiispira papahanaumokuakeensis]
MNMLKKLHLWFPVLAIVFASLAYGLPHLLTTPLLITSGSVQSVLSFLGWGHWQGESSQLWLLAPKDMIVPLLSLIMFCMGLTLTPADFVRVARRPMCVAVGVGLQFLIMPLAAWGVALLLNLPDDLLIGMVVVGATAGGTASNVMAWLAGANVALSVTMTLTSTLASIVATPLLTALYVGHTVDVPLLSMMTTIASIVLGPIVLGMLFNRLFNRWVSENEVVLACVSMLAIVLIIGIVVALNQQRLAVMGSALILAVMLHNSIGLFLGYRLSRLLGMAPYDARAIAIEVGMQNSGLAAALSAKLFGVGSALPGVLFSVWHNISGSLLAGYWGRRQQMKRQLSEID